MMASKIYTKWAQSQKTDETAKTKRKYGVVKAGKQNELITTKQT